MAGNANERGTAEFNMGVSYLNRLNTLFYIADDAAMTLKVNEWMHALMAIFREISTEMKDTEIEKTKEKFNKININVQVANETYKRKGVMEVSPETYDSLHNVELDLRKVLKESGLQMKMKQAAGEALE